MKPLKFVGILIAVLLAIMLGCAIKAQAQNLINYDSSSSFLLTTSYTYKADTVKMTALVTTPEIKVATECFILGYQTDPYGIIWNYLTMDKKPIPRGFIVWMATPIKNELPRYRRTN